MTAVIKDGSKPTSGSATFRVDSDDGIWWIKPLNNPQGARVPINELIIGRAGALIHAPVCQVAVIEIPSVFKGEKYGSNKDISLDPGLVSGSRHIDGAHEIRGLDHHAKDDNACRIAGVVAHYDWCWGADDQWLYAADEDERIYSHDHGHWLPNGPNWEIQHLEAEIEKAHLVPNTKGIDPDALKQYAKRLNAVSHDDIVGILRGVPEKWPVTATELETVGWFLEYRADQVASRLEKLADELAKGGSKS